MEQPKMNLDLKKTTPVLTKSGKKIWQQGFVLRKVSRFITGAGEDMILPLQIYFDPETGEINLDGVPQEMRFIIENED